MEISVAIPTHGDRWKWIEKTIKNIHNLRCVKEIFVCDDGSGMFVGDQMRENLKPYRKAFYIGFEFQQFVFKNKLRSVRACSCASQWVALLDSDNIFTADYFHAAENYVNSGMYDIYCPCEARPRFDWSEFRGQSFTKENVSGLAKSKKFNVLLNTGNYIVKRDLFLNALSNVEYAPSCCDVIVAARYLLEAGAKFFVVPNMRYEHTVHNNSTYLSWVNKEPGATEAAQAAILEMK